MTRTLGPYDDEEFCYNRTYVNRSVSIALDETGCHGLELDGDAEDLTLKNDLRVILKQYKKTVLSKHLGYS